MNMTFVVLALGLMVGLIIGFGLCWAVSRWLWFPRQRQQWQQEHQAQQEQLALHKQEKNQLMAQMGRLRSAMGAKEKQVWLRYDTYQAQTLAPRIQRSIPILTIASLKGGVGKTTLCANLAAFFDTALNKRVLLIDLDYQGSLSALALNAAGAYVREETLVHMLLDNKDHPSTVASQAISLRPALNKSSLLSAFYDFATFENQIMLEWLIGDLSYDARFAMAQYLHAPEIQRQFDLVLIDCPPRLSTGVINALTSSTHLLIPTRLDRMSGQTVTTFVRQLNEMRDLLFPALDIAGVAGTMVESAAGLSPTENGIWQDLRTELTAQWPTPIELLAGAEIPQKSAVAAASGSRFVYLADPSSREVFERLGYRLADKLFAEQGRFGQEW